MYGFEFILKYLHPMKRYFILALIGLILGLAFGYLGVRLDHYSNENDWLNLFMLPSFPGFMAAMIHWDHDWVSDEASEYLWAITVFNGLFWMVAFPVFSFYIYLAKCLWRDMKSAYQKWSFLAKLFIHDKTRL